MFEEALACYRAGAFRACIVSTWLSVVYDVMSKLRELALAGDRAAAAQVAELDQIVREHNTDQSLAFERGILKLARDDFELVSHNEHLDLERLREDRHRCAHPSLNQPGEVYRPSAEAARAHMRVAAESLLAHAPVQGRAAMERVFKEIESELFPTDIGRAEQYLRLGPMGRPRDALLKNVVLALVSSLLTTDDQMPQKVAALAGLRKLHYAGVEPYIRKRLSEKAPSLEDDALWRVIFFVSRLPDTWQYVPEVTVLKLKAFVANARLGRFLPPLIRALDVPDLRAVALERVKRMSADELEKAISVIKRREFVDHALEIYGASRGTKAASVAKRQLLMPLLEEFSGDDIDRLIFMASENSSIRESYAFPNLVSTLRSMDKVDVPRLNAQFAKYPILEAAGRRAAALDEELAGPPDAAKAES